MEEILFYLKQTIPYTKWGWFVFTGDLVLVYFLTYQLLKWIKQTHSSNLVRGLLIVFLFYSSSRILGFKTLNWIVEKIATALILIAIIVFQPELRRFLERVGTGKLFGYGLAQRDSKSTAIIKQLLKSVESLSKEKIGALIVIEAGTNLNEYIESGISLRAIISSELIRSLFWPKTPTHDGAIIIRDNKIEAAGCLLPLSDTPLQDRRLGTRHRAALALSQLTDAVVIVVSEESGTISLAENGNLTRFLNREALETRLFSLYRESEPSLTKGGRS